MKTKKLIFPLLILLLASLACQLPVSGLNPTATVPVTTDTSSQVISTLGASSSSTLPGEITVTITASQLTSLLVEQLAQQSDFSFENLKVLIQNNQIEISGKVQKSGFSTNAKVALGVSVDNAGQLQVSINTIDLGLLPVPDSYKESLQSSINSMVNDYVRPMISGYRITSVDLSNDAITIKAGKQ